MGINPTRDGVITILRAMGANIEVLNERQVGGEPVADLRVRHAPLKGIEIPVEAVPLAIDELPAVLIAAACAEGVTVLQGAEELRVKESDRIAVWLKGYRNWVSRTRAAGRDRGGRRRSVRGRDHNPPRPPYRDELFHGGAQSVRPHQGQ